MLKKYKYLYGSIGIGFILFVLFIPAILSSSWGNDQLIKIINKKIFGKVKIDSIQLSWFGPQIIEGLKLESLTEEEMLKSDRIKLETPLYKLIMKKGLSNSLFIDNFYIHFIQEPSHASNLDLALGLPLTPKISKNLPHKLDIILENTDINIILNDLHSLESFFSKGSTKEGLEKGDFIIDLSLNPKNSHLKGSFTHFPVGIIDTLFQLEYPKYAGLILSILGNTVDISIEQQIDKEIENFKGSISSKNMSAQFKGKIDSSMISLSEPGKFKLNLSPEAFSTLLKNNNCTVDIGINESLSADLILQEFKFPLSFFNNNNQLHHSQLGLVAFLNFSKTQILSSNLETPLDLHNLQIVIDSPENSNSILFHIQAEAAENNQPIHLLLKGKVLKPLRADFSLLDLYKDSAEGSLDLKNVPTKIIDQFFCTEPSIASLIGNSLSCKIKAISSDNEALFNLSLNTEKLFIEDMSWRLGQKLSLIKSSEIIYKANPNTLLSSDVSSFFSESPFLVTLKLKELLIPLSFSQGLSSYSLDTLFSSIKPSYLEGQLLIKEIESKENPFGKFKISPVIIDFKGNPYGLASVNVNSTLDVRESSFLTSLFGPQLTIQNNLAIQWNGINHWNLIPWTLNLSSDQLHGTLKGKVINNELYLTSSSDIRFNLNQNTLEQLGIKSSNHHVSLKETAPVKIHLFSMDEPISLNNLARLILSGSIQLDLASFNIDGAIENEKEDVYIKDLNIRWNLNGPNNKLTFKFSGKTQFNSLTSQQLAGTINLFKWRSPEGVSLENLEIGTKIELNKVPTIFLESLFHYDYLIELLGKATDLTLNSYFSLNKKNIDLDLSILGEKFESNIALKLNDYLQIIDSSPANLNMTVSPQQFQLLRKIITEYLDNESSMQNLHLKEPITFSLKVDNLKIPVKDTRFSLPESIKADISIDKVYLENQNDKSMYFENISGKINSKNLAEELTFYLEVFSKNNEHFDPIKISGEFNQLLTPGDNINLSGLNLSLNAEARRIPVDLMCELSCASPRFQRKLEALIGESMDLKISSKLHQMHGPLNLYINGTNGTFKLESEIINGFLILKTPFESSIKITPVLGKNVLEDILPLLGEVSKGDNPITITIDPKDFSIPIDSYDFSKIKMSNIMINLGKMSFSKTSALASIFNLLQPNYNEPISVYFTPLYMDIDLGIMTIKRMDLLVINQFPLAVWGKINFIKDKVDMRIGLTGRALNQALNITGLDSNYMMQLPIKGNLKEAFINKTKAAARISALMAQTTGSTQGIILGTVLDIAGGKLTEEAAPQPTTNPLPWELSLDPTNIENTNDSNSLKKTKKIRSSFFEEKASEILNSIFK